MNGNERPVVTGIAVENGKSVIHMIVGGSRVVIDTNVLGFAHLAKLGVPVTNVSAERKVR